MTDEELTKLVDKVASASGYGGLDSSTMYGEFALDVAKAVRAEILTRYARDLEMGAVARDAVVAGAVVAERERCAVTWEKLAAAARPGERIDDTLRRYGDVIRGA